MSSNDNTVVSQLRCRRCLSYHELAHDANVDDAAADATKSSSLTLMWTSRMSAVRLQQLGLLVALVMLIVVAPQTVQGHGRGHHSQGQQQQQHQSASRVSRQSRDASGVESGGFHDSKIVHDADHINEHLQGKAAVNVSEMSIEELEFHYFKMHDFDNNTKLDGLEILKALTHLLPYDSVDDDDKKKVDTRGKTTDEILQEKREKELSYYTEIVDNVLADDDIDDDGFLTYPEYILARRREEAREERDEMHTAEAARGGHESNGL